MLSKKQYAGHGRQYYDYSFKFCRTFVQDNNCSISGSEGGIYWYNNIKEQTKKYYTNEIKEIITDYKLNNEKEDEEEEKYSLPKLNFDYDKNINEILNDINLEENKKFTSIDNNNKPGEDKTESNLDVEKETDIERMNIKFYEALDFDSDNEIKDVSTDLETEDNSNTEKIFMKISDYLNLNKESIENNNNKVLKSYKNQIKFEEKIKELSKKYGSNFKNSKDIKDYAN